MARVEVPGDSVPIFSHETLGETIPPNTPHAISVSLPTWRSNVGYEEGEDWVVQKMRSGYPRFVIHKSIQKLARSIVAAHGSLETEYAMLLPSGRSAGRCRDFILEQCPHVHPSTIRQLDFVHDPNRAATEPDRVLPTLSAVIYHKDLWPAAKAFWQHTGEGIQSRRADFCQRAFDDHSLVEQNSISHPQTCRMVKGPKRYRRQISVDHDSSKGADVCKKPMDAEPASNGENFSDSSQFVEERFGRNLNLKFAAQAKLAIRRRIAGSLTANTDLPQSLDEPTDTCRMRTSGVPGFSVEDVYLFPCGMNAIYTSHRALRLARGEELRSIMYGFPYVDTLKVLEKFGAGVLFYGHGDADDIDDLEGRLEGGERFLALYCEFPSNPLLKTPDLHRLRALADRYELAIVVDETIGNFINVHVLPWADIVVSSLTKVFSGDSNVMGGAMILHPLSRYYAALRGVLASEYEDTQFAEDSVYLERNSRDFVERVQRINRNADTVAAVLRASPRVRQVYHPRNSASQTCYDACLVPGGGYGGLVSATFHSVDDAAAFYDRLETAKGPSLGTNFTLSSPFVLLAHYAELDWAARYGCDASLVRFSIGLEDGAALAHIFRAALDAIPESTQDDVGNGVDAHSLTRAHPHPPRPALEAVQAHP